MIDYLYIRSGEIYLHQINIYMMRLKNANAFTPLVPFRDKSLTGLEVFDRKKFFEFFSRLNYGIKRSGHQSLYV